MSMRSGRLTALVVLVVAFTLRADEPKLSQEQKKEFLLNARVIKSKQASKGVTSPYRLTLTDGNITHDAAFQSINEHKPKMEFANGKIEMNFVDSYKYDIAAYELAKLLDLEEMMPVTVERKWNGKSGALSWWLPTKMDEEKRLKQKIQPPSPDAWNRQMYKMRVFTQLVYDTDRNLGNVLIGENWELYMIDFSRAFRQYYDLLNPKDLISCDRKLLEKLRTLDANEFTEKTKGLLTRPEVNGVMHRRDKIVALFEKLIAEHGEAAVLY